MRHVVNEWWKVEGIKKSIKTEKPVTYEDLIELPSGKKYYSSTFTKITDNNKQILGVQILSQDITKSKIAEANILSLKDKQRDDLKKFQMAIEGASDHIIITDHDGIILYANHAVEKITGYSNEEIIGKKAGNKELWGGQMENITYKKF